MAIRKQMTAKRSWLLARMLIPAGILPPAITYDGLRDNEVLRQKIGNVGFEYFYMLDQDPEKINASAIGGKIFVVHAPWPFFPHVAARSPLVQILINHFVYDQNKISNDFAVLAEKTLGFAKAVGAKVVVIHAFAFENFTSNLMLLKKLEKKYAVTATIEHEGPHFPDIKTASIKKTIGPHAWMRDPQILAKKVAPHKVCLDTCSLIGCQLPLVTTTQKILPQVGHVHLADSQPDLDEAGEIKNPEIAQVLDILYQKRYPGFITLEINGSAGKLEEFLVKIYGGSALFRFPLFKKTVVRNAQRHIYNSAAFLLKYFP